MAEYARLLKTEFLKQRGTFAWALVAGTPLLVVALTFIHLNLRYDYLMNLPANQGLTPWLFLLVQHHFLWSFFFSLVVTVLAAQVYHLEEKSNYWKHVLALPVSRVKVYLAKGSLVFIQSLLMIGANTLGLVCAGKMLGLPAAPELSLLARYTFYQITAVSGLISLQCWLSHALPSTTLALGAGFLGVSSSLFMAQSEHGARFFPYAHPVFALPEPTVDNAIALCYGPVFGVLFLLVGLITFQRKEIY